MLLAVAGLLTAALLAWLAGLRSWWFALAPPLVLYAFHNWDLFAVCATVVAFWALLRGSRIRSGAPQRPGAHRAASITPVASARSPGRPVSRSENWPPARSVPVAEPQDDRPSRAPGDRGRGAGCRGAFKLYPLMFVLPIALWLGTGGWRPDRWKPNASRGPVGGSPPRLFAVGAAAVFLLINLPFMIIGWRGWWASFQFQWSRPIDLTTNTIWFWATRPYSDSSNAGVQADLATAATVCTLAALLVACVLGFLRFGRGRAYPWLPVCAAMICGYLLFNKVHSPQFTLWLLPFFVLLRIRAGWILAYFVADAAIGIGFFRWQYLIGSGRGSGVYDALSPQLVMIGVWGRAALLICLFIVFLRAQVVAAPRSRPTRTAAALAQTPAPAASQTVPRGQCCQRPWRRKHAGICGAGICRAESVAPETVASETRAAQPNAAVTSAAATGVSKQLRRKPLRRGLRNRRIRRVALRRRAGRSRQGDTPATTQQDVWRVSRRKAIL